MSNNLLTVIGFRSSAGEPNNAAEFFGRSSHSSIILFLVLINYMWCIQYLKYTNKHNYKRTRKNWQI